MADSPAPSSPVTPPSRTNRPMSEALLNEKVRHMLNAFKRQHRVNAWLYTTGNQLIYVAQWDHCLSTLLIRSTLGASFGIIFSVLLFKRRSWPVFTGLGFGAGRAWEECDSVRVFHSLYDQHDSPISCARQVQKGGRLQQTSLLDLHVSVIAIDANILLCRASSERRRRPETVFECCGHERQQAACEDCNFNPYSESISCPKSLRSSKYLKRQEGRDPRGDRGGSYQATCVYK